MLRGRTFRLCIGLLGGLVAGKSHTHMNTQVERERERGGRAWGVV